MMESRFRQQLLDWFGRVKRQLPWRRTRDPYRIWISEIMLQQTRVSTVLPYYERFLSRLPDVAALAAAPEPELLALWSGLGYYARARNLQRAARQIVAQGGFPRDAAGLCALPGIGDYTAAAIASIAYGEACAVLDGNVARVVARLSHDTGDISATATRRRLRSYAQRLLDPDQPGRFNEAMMELGATLCAPRAPQCGECPVSEFCQARRSGTQEELPVKLRRPATVHQERTLLIVESGEALALWQRGAESRRLAGFWELPEPSHLPEARVERIHGTFRHSITHHQFRFRVARARCAALPSAVQWVPRGKMAQLPLSTATRKALQVAGFTLRGYDL